MAMTFQNLGWLQSSKEQMVPAPGAAKGSPIANRRATRTADGEISANDPHQYSVARFRVASLGMIVAPLGPTAPFVSVTLPYVTRCGTTWARHDSGPRVTNHALTPHGNDFINLDSCWPLSTTRLFGWRSIVSAFSKVFSFPYIISTNQRGVPFLWIQYMYICRYFYADLGKDVGHRHSHNVKRLWFSELWGKTIAQERDSWLLLNSDCFPRMLSNRSRVGFRLCRASLWHEPMVDSFPGCGGSTSRSGAGHLAFDWPYDY